jgi:DNA-binding CsgD family transcriptional regulator
MSTPIRASDRDLRALAAIVSQDREDPPDGEELPPSLLADLNDQIRCDLVQFVGIDSSAHAWWFRQEDPVRDLGEDLLAVTREVYWKHYGDSRFCSYPSRTGDLGSIVKYSDFESVRQRHSTAMYTDRDRLVGTEHALMLCLPEAQPSTAGSGRHVRMYFIRGPGPDFSERDRAVLTLLRPHLHQAYRAAEQRRHPVPRLTPRQNELLRLLAAGHTNSRIARQLGISEGTVRTHLENIYDKLGVSSRTAAVTRAFPDGTADQSAAGPGQAPPALLLPSSFPR